MGCCFWSFLSLCLVLSLDAAVYGRAFACFLQLYVGRRQAVLVIAGTVCEIAVDAVVGLGELDLLHEFHVVLEETQFHSEQFVELRLFIADGCEFSHQFDAFLTVHCQRCLYGSVIAEISGINMPSLIDFSCEDNLAIGGVARFESCGELHRLKYLGAGNESKTQ